jgi:hypothetical protein
MAISCFVQAQAAHVLQNAPSLAGVGDQYTDTGLGFVYGRVMEIIGIRANTVLL